MMRRAEQKDAAIEQKPLRTEIQLFSNPEGSYELVNNVAENAQVRRIEIEDRPPEMSKALIDFGHKESPEKRLIDTVVVHTLYNDKFKGEERFLMDNIIAILKAHDVAPHYVIDRSGRIVQLVEDNDTAWHAGKSQLPEQPERGGLNAFSLGVELVNAEDTEVTDEQYRALAYLIQRKIKDGMVKNIVSHKTIAPKRKTDPWNFDWAVFGDILKRSMESR